MNILYIFVALIIVLYFAFSNHNQHFIYSKQFKFIFITLLITLSSYNYTLALISLLLYIAFNEYHIENFSNSSKNTIQADSDVTDAYKKRFCTNCGKEAKSLLSDMTETSENQQKVDELFNNIFFK